MVKLKCYIEEYKDNSGCLCARLREKESNKIVQILVNESSDRLNLLCFLSAAKQNVDVMPTVYQRYGKDIVAVCGIIRGCDTDSIVVSLKTRTFLSMINYLSGIMQKMKQI